MLCVVDIGNTNIVIALMESSDNICFSGRIITNRDLTKDNFKKELSEVIGKSSYGIKDIEGVIISSVVPEVTESVKQGMVELTGVNVIVMSCELNLGLTISMDNPHKVGCDLIADAVAVNEEYSGVTAIFDMGTATTCSLVKENEYLGTIIIPGVVISQNALSEKASQLPKLSLDSMGDFKVRLMGKNTVESMTSGMIYGNAAMIDGIIERIEDEMGIKVSVVATGGIAELIVPHCKKNIVLDKNLLLKGLWYTYKRNVCG